MVITKEIVMLEPTNSRQIATLITWDNQRSIAKTDDGGIIELHAEQMAYAPMQQGARIEIFWQDGKVEHWRHLPQIAEMMDDVSDAKLADMAGTKFHVQVAHVVKQECLNMAILVFILVAIYLFIYEFSVQMVLGAVVGGVVARLPTWYRYAQSSWAWTSGETGLVVSKLAQFGISNAPCHRFLMWQDIDNAVVCKTRLLRQPYLLITPRIPQANIKLALYLLSPADQAQTVQIIQSRK